MKHFYSAIAATMMLAAGAMNAEARFWTYDYQTNVDAASIQPGVWYCLQGGQSFLDGGYTAFLSGELHSTSQNLTTDNLYQFEPTGETTEDGATVYYLKRYDGTYLYATGQANFYGPAVDRAWKIAVREANVLNPDEIYEDYNEETGETDELTGVAAYVALAKENGEEFNLYNATYCGAEHGLVFAAAAADDATDPYSTYTYLLGLGAGAKTGGASRGTDYNKNTWVLFPATEQSAKESLEAIVFEITNGEMSLDLSEYQLGEGAGEYSEELYNAFMELWEKAQAVINGEASLSDAEIDDVAEKLKPALEAFKNSGKGLTEGYYILRSMRPRADWTSSAYPWGRNGSGYDDGAIYDGSAINASDANLRWSYKADDEVAFYLEGLDKTAYETAKFVWKATKAGKLDDDGNELYYFQNIETEKYIGKDPKTYSPVVMHDTPQVAFTIAANPNFPGWFSFYSPALTVASEDARFPADYSGLHCSSDVNNVVAWDWRVGGSCWKVETLTEDEVEMLRDNLAGPQRVNKAKSLVAQYEDYMVKGYSYDGYNADGTKSLSAKTGSLELDGLVTSVEQIACPMNETSEGSMENLFDGDKGTYMHSTWSSSWKGDHYLEMTIDQPETDLLFKWVKRFKNDGTTNNSGAPLNVVIWGTNNEADLAIDKAEDAATADEFNAWQNTWKELGKATFEYTLAVEETNTANAVGFAHVQLSEPVKYIRMAVKTRVADGDVPNGNKYFHGSEFRLYKSVLNMEESLISAVPAEVLKALQDAVELANEAIADGEVSEELLNQLQAALDKFLEYFPEPAKLSDAITEAKTLTENAEEGEGLGFYEPGAIAALEKAIAEAEAKVKPVMTISEINNALAALAAAVDAYNAALHVPASGLYVIKSESENEANTGRAITATYSSTTDAMNHRGGADEANTELRPGSYWLVEKVEGGYTYKNLYTGRYLAPVGTKRDLITQSDEPYVFGIRFAKTPGCFNITVAEEDAYNGNYFYANVQPNTGKLVTWTDATGRDNSAFSFHVQSVEEVDAKLAESGMLFDVYYPGAAQLYTFPVDMDVFVEGEAGAFYSVIGQDSQNNIQLKALAEGTVLKAGQAYVYVSAEGTTDKTAIFYMPQGVELSKAAKTTEVKNENGLCGVFESQELVAGLGVFSTDHSKVLVSEEGDVAAAGTGFFAQMPKTTETGDITLACNGEIVSEAGITAIIDNRKADNSIYTISGVRMNSMKNLPAGLYIIGGKKYIVK